MHELLHGAPCVQSIAKLLKACGMIHASFPELRHRLHTLLSTTMRNRGFIASIVERYLDDFRFPISLHVPHPFCVANRKVLIGTIRSCITDGDIRLVGVAQHPEHAGVVQVLVGLFSPRFFPIALSVVGIVKLEVSTAVCLAASWRIDVDKLYSHKYKY